MVRQLVDSMIDSVPANQLEQQQIAELLASLPRVTDAELTSLGHDESVCPICFTKLLAILAEEEMAVAMDSPAHPVEELGVTRLKDTCGHLFCRKDIGKWIRDGHDSCPMCRRPLIPLSNEEGTDQPQADHPSGPPLRLGPHQDFLDALAAMASHYSTRAGNSSGTSYDDDRSGFAGMYS